MTIARIEEVKQEQEIFTDLWKIYKKYLNISTDVEWNDYVDETNKLFMDKYKHMEKKKMFLDMFLAVSNQLERNYEERINK